MRQIIHGDRQAEGEKSDRQKRAGLNPAARARAKMAKANEPLKRFVITESGLKIIRGVFAAAQSIRDHETKLRELS